MFLIFKEKRLEYSTEQIIEIVGISRRTLQNWLTTGKVIKPKEQGKQRRWTAEDIKLLIRVKSGETGGAKEVSKSKGVSKT